MNTLMTPNSILQELCRIMHKVTGGKFSPEANAVSLLTSRDDVNSVAIVLIVNGEETKASFPNDALQLSLDEFSTAYLVPLVMSVGAIKKIFATNEKVRRMRIKMSLKGPLRVAA